jgi:hypothetical protein
VWPQPVIEDVGHFARGEPPVQHHQRGIQMRGPEQQLEELRRVLRPVRHPVADGYPFSHQAVRHSVGNGGQLGVGLTPVASDDRHPVTVRRTALVDELAQSPHRLPPSESRPQSNLIFVWVTPQEVGASGRTRTAAIQAAASEVPPIGLADLNKSAELLTRMDRK